MIVQLYNNTIWDKIDNNNIILNNNNNYSNINIQNNTDSKSKGRIYIQKIINKIL